MLGRLHRFAAQRRRVCEPERSREAVPCVAVSAVVIWRGGFAPFPQAASACTT
jgi:hypothetical protein